MVRAGSGDSLPARPDGLVERGGVAIALEQGDQHGDKVAQPLGFPGMPCGGLLGGMPYRADRRIQVVAVPGQLIRAEKSRTVIRLDDERVLAAGHAFVHCLHMVRYHSVQLGLAAAS